jgi:hypothetical protein
MQDSERSVAAAQEAKGIGVDMAATSPLMAVGWWHLRDWMAAADHCMSGQKAAVEDLAYPK